MSAPGASPERWKLCGGAVEVVDPRLVDRPYQIHRRVADFAEIVRVGFKVERDTFPFEDGKQFVHGAPERGLALGRLLLPPVELGVHQVAAEFNGDLDHPFPVPHGRLALGFVGTGPFVQGQDARELDTGLSQHGFELRHLVVVGAGMQEERHELLPRGELDVGVSEFGDGAHHLLHRQRAEHVRIESDFHAAPPA
jgi:hypothetical protein